GFHETGQALAVHFPGSHFAVPLLQPAHAPREDFLQQHSQRLHSCEFKDHLHHVRNLRRVFALLCQLPNQPGHLRRPRRIRCSPIPQQRAAISPHHLRVTFRRQHGRVQYQRLHLIGWLTANTCARYEPYEEPATTALSTASVSKTAARPSAAASTVTSDSVSNSPSISARQCPTPRCSTMMTSNPRVAGLFLEL